MVFSGNSSGSFGSDMLILDNGNLRSGNGSYTVITGVLSFGSERGSGTQVPQVIWRTTDAYNEYCYTTSWSLWLH